MLKKIFKTSLMYTRYLSLYLLMIRAKDLSQRNWKAYRIILQQKGLKVIYRFYEESFEVVDFLEKMR